MSEVKKCQHLSSDNEILKILGSIIASMASFVAGAVGAFVSVETYAMEKGQGGIKITLEEASWIGKEICCFFFIL